MDRRRRSTTASGAGPNGGVWERIFADLAGVDVVPIEALHRQVLHQGPPHCLWRKRGGLAHVGIGITKGGRNTKLHAVCDEKGRPHVLLLTPGNTHDGKVAIQTINAGIIWLPTKATIATPCRLG